MQKLNLQKTNKPLNISKMGSVHEFDNSYESIIETDRTGNLSLFHDEPTSRAVPEDTDVMLSNYQSI